MSLKQKSIGLYLIFSGILLLGACGPTPGDSSFTAVEGTTINPSTETPMVVFPAPTEPNTAIPTENAVEVEHLNLTATSTKQIGENALADVLSVKVSGDEKAYQFAVEIRSPDNGCEQYADWWEVISENGELIYRRILAHSHVTEQPFTRSGGPVAIRANTVVILRAHMHSGGYGGVAFQGSVTEGFDPIQLAPDFAAGLETLDPLPEGCAF